MLTDYKWFYRHLQIPGAILELLPRLTCTLGRGSNAALDTMVCLQLGSQNTGASSPYSYTWHVAEKISKWTNKRLNVQGIRCLMDFCGPVGALYWFLVWVLYSKKKKNTIKNQHMKMQSISVVIMWNMGYRADLYINCTLRQKCFCFESQRPVYN